MYATYRRLTDEDIFWRKRHVRYIGMFLVSMFFLSLLFGALALMACFPLYSVIGIAGVVVGLILGRFIK